MALVAVFKVAQPVVPAGSTPRSMSIPCRFPALSRYSPAVSSGWVCSAGAGNGTPRLKVRIRETQTNPGQSRGFCFAPMNARGAEVQRGSMKTNPPLLRREVGGSGARLKIRLHPELKEILRHWPRSHLAILTTVFGKPFSAQMPCWQNKRRSKIPKPQLAAWETGKFMSDIKVDLFTWCPGVESNHGHRDFQACVSF